MILSFARLGVEESEFCVMHANHSALCEHAQSYDVCQKRVQHKQLTGKIRRQNKPMSADHSLCSVDLQKSFSVCLQPATLKLYSFISSCCYVRCSDVCS